MFICFSPTGALSGRIVGEFILTPVYSNLPRCNLPRYNGGGPLEEDKSVMTPVYVNLPPYKVDGLLKVGTDVSDQIVVDPGINTFRKVDFPLCNSYNITIIGWSTSTINLPMYNNLSLCNDYNFDAMYAMEKVDLFLIIDSGLLQE